jgi:hypothetical protein
MREIELEEFRSKIRGGIESPVLAAADVFQRLEAKYQAMFDKS